MFKSGLKTSAMLAVAVLSASSALAIDQNDGAVCGALTPDPNGGCNVTPNAYQDVGAYGVGDFISITGTIGTYTPAGGTGGNTSRDLDWYSFTLTEEAHVTITLSRDDGSSVVLFVGENAVCPATTFYGLEQASFTPVEFYLPAGQYIVIATTPFEADPLVPVHACGGYSLTVDIQAGDSTCGTGSILPCDVAHAPNKPGCDDWACCNLVCLSDPTCCSDTWDAACVTNGAVAICGYFIYSCADTNPANDCLTSAGALALNTTVAWDNTNANTDGPSNAITGGASGTVSDLWYMVQAPGNGQLTIVANAPTVDVVLELYGPFATGSVTDPEEQMLPAYIGTIDNFGAGGEGVTLVDAESGKYYLVRVGSWTDAPATGAGDITATFAQVVYTTGIQQFVVQPTGNVNLGLSSGALSAAQPRRWLARPFKVPAPGAGNVSWDLSQIIAKGFIATAPVETLNWIIWKADAAFAIKPVAADQLFSGSVPLPTPFNDALDDSATSSYPIVLDPPVNLTEGNYYLTVYGAAANDFAHGGTAACNWAWFIYSPGAVRQVLPNGTAYSWRSADFNTGGFLLYQGLATGSNVQAGDDQLDVYNNAFTILGAPVAGGVVCTGDLDNSGTVDAADLAGLLGQWGGPGSADFDGSGTVDAADLAQLLGAWGACP